MELTLKRTRFANCTSGQLHINGEYECVTLEDQDRGLTQSMTLEQVQAKKVYGKTAIPSGRYQVVLTFSDHFNRVMPLLLNVKGYGGIRIHSGKTPAHTLGCLLVGLSFTTVNGGVTISGDAFTTLYKKLEQASKREKIYITIS